MRIGIVSDTHNQIARVEKVLRLLEQAQVDLILHCGDIEDADVVWRFPAHTHFVFGNCDMNRASLHQAMADIGATLHDPFGELDLPGGKLAFIHGDNSKLLRQLIDSAAYDFVFHGHTHEAREECAGKTRIVNPGALHRAAVKTCAVLDWARKALEQIVVD